MDIITFRETIGHFEADLNTKKLIKKLYKLKKEKPISDARSNIRGWQKDLLNINEFSYLKKHIAEKFGEYYLKSSNEFVQQKDKQKDNNNYRIFITALFCNINSTNAYNVLHSHQGGQYTFVIWLKCEEDCGKLYIRNPFPSEDLWNLYRNSYDTNDYSFKVNRLIMSPKKNTGLFFNSKILHEVGTNYSKHDRISIAGNIYIDDSSLRS